MTISTEQIFKEILDLDSEQIPLARLAFFREELRNRLHAEVVRRFHTLADNGFTKAHLARRIGKSPEQVIRWLGAPGNWTLDTASDLLTGMRSVPVIEIDDLANTLAPVEDDAIESQMAAKFTTENAKKQANKQKDQESFSNFSPTPKFGSPRAGFPTP